jgi:hypothetical protein
MGIQREIKEILANTPDIEVERPEPPSNCNEEEAKIWRDIVKCMPASWFPSQMLPMLRELCQHICMARRFGNHLKAVTDEPPANRSVLQIIRTLDGMYISHSKMVLLLSIRLRLHMGPKSMMRDARAKFQERPPWEIPTKEELDRELSRQERELMSGI